MYTLYETEPSIEDIAEIIKDKTSKLLEILPIESTNEIVKAQTCIPSGESTLEDLYLITEGIVSFSINNKHLYYLEKGDIISPERTWTNSRAEYHAEFAVKVVRYKYEDFIRLLYKNEEALLIWQEIRSYQLQVLHIMLASHVNIDTEMKPEFKSVEEDEVIILQNSTGSDVYTLIDGRLEVLVDDVPVGIIESDEIFGALAALTGTRRTATVKSITPSLFMQLPVNRFKELMLNRPNTVIKMIEDMSKTVVSLNTKVVELTMGKSNE